MQQMPVGNRGGYCPFCGAPVTVAGARFCAVCGRDMMTGAPHAGQGAPVAQTAYAPPGYQPVFVPADPMGVAAQPYSAPARSARANIWRMLGIGVPLLIVIYVLTIGLRGLVFDPASTLAAVVLTYLIGARRLAVASAWRVWAEVMVATGALVVLVWMVTYFYIVVVEHYQYWAYDSMYFFPRFAIAVALAGIIGTACALLAGSWRAIRSQQAGVMSNGWGYVALLTGIATLFCFVWVAVLGRYYFYVFYVFTILPALALLVLLIVGCALAAGWINRRLAQSAAPSWSPTPAQPYTPPMPGATAGAPYTPLPTPPVSTLPPTIPPQTTPPITLDPNQ